GTVCVVGKIRDLILQLSKSSIYSTKPTGTGKSYLIERTLPGRIIDARLLLVKNDWHGPVPFSLRGAKPGPVGIDESSSFSEETLRQNAENLKERGVVYTAQSIDKAAKVAANLPNRRVLLIMIGKT
ncbi:hypothetical protein M8446_23855, partial [Citrobacter freundii]|nr:hypothetical protein [Citrobacter freundii]